MSLQPAPIGPIPEDTALVARAAFPKGHPYLTLRDSFGTLFSDEDFADLYSERGQPTYSPWRLALVTVLQFRENLSDRQAAEAVRGRIDWKYLLGLPLTDPGFDHTVLTEFRKRLLAGGAEDRLLDVVLGALREEGLLKARGRQRTDATYVIASIRELSRLELLGETMRQALNEIAAETPEWLRKVAPADWFERYSRRTEEGRLPRSDAKREEYASVVGQDGIHLLRLVEQVEAPPHLAFLSSVQTLRRVWREQYEQKGETEEEEEEPTGDAASLCLKPSRSLCRANERIASPYDVEARYCHRHSTTWTGYRVHLTETCDTGCPRFVVHVDTTPAPVHEAGRIGPIHEALARKGFLPGRHLVDTAYAGASAVVASRRKHQVDLIGPVIPNTSWQKKSQGGFGADEFEIDWERREVRCPAGKTSVIWTEGTERTRNDQPFVRVRFRTEDCHACALRTRCTNAKRYGRQLTFRPREQYEAICRARDPAGEPDYRMRQGIEGTISQGVRCYGLRQTRYRGTAKTHLQHVATAAALDLDRLIGWVDRRPIARTRTSRFVRLAPLADA